MFTWRNSCDNAGWLHAQAPLLLKGGDAKTRPPETFTNGINTHTNADFKVLYRREKKSFFDNISVFFN